MASWERVSAKRTGVQILPYYHMSGMDGFAKEFMDLCLSTLYAQKTNDFLWVFDVINPITTEICYFQKVLKKNNLIRFLPYFPSSGFQIRGRQDLIQPIVERGKLPDKIFIYDIARSLFDIQDKVRETNIMFFEKHEIPREGVYQAGILLHPSCTDFSVYLNKLGDIPRDNTVFVYVACSNRETFEACKKAFPSQWNVISLHMTGELHTQTTEQKIKRYFLEIAELVVLRNCPILVGTFQDPVAMFMGLLENRFRENPTAFRSIDGKPFRIYS